MKINSFSSNLSPFTQYHIQLIKFSGLFVNALLFIKSCVSFKLLSISFDKLIPSVSHNLNPGVFELT